MNIKTALIALAVCILGLQGCGQDKKEKEEKERKEKAAGIMGDGKSPMPKKGQNLGGL